MTDKQTLLNELHMSMIQLYAGDPRRIQHFCKVHSYSKLIAEGQGLDSDTLFTLEAAAITHDIGIHVCEEKYGNCEGKLQEKEGPALADAMMGKLGFERDVIERVKYLIAHHHTYTDIDSPDYQILVEADFLVNMFEDSCDKSAVERVYNTIFRTETGKRICREMFDL